ncbi:MAG: hypothetical protein H7A55_12190 [Verrucomicrobiaceae bacterium]|nr:hypothetical protein [Verrucomicrobiaceae bacterium]
MNRKSAIVCLALLLVSLPAGRALAQSPGATAAAAPSQAQPDDSRLKQYETTYQSELKKLHVPMLSKYLLDLQRLSAQTTDSTEQAAITAEIGRVQKIITAGGVIDLATAARGTRESAPPGAMGTGTDSLAKRQARTLFTLTPADARAVAPHYTGATDAAAVAQITWKIDALPSGSYEVIAEYSFPDIADDTVIKVTVADQAIETKLTTMRATKDATQFRILKIGRLDLPSALSKEALTLTVGDGQTAPYPLLRQLIIARAKKEERPDSPPPPPPKKDEPTK